MTLGTRLYYLELGEIETIVLPFLNEKFINHRYHKKLPSGYQTNVKFDETFLL